MKVEIITISSQLLRGQAINENVAFLTREFVTLGIPVRHSSMLLDDPEV